MNKLIDEHSAPCATNQLNLFEVPPTQISIDHSYWHTVHLSNSCTNTGPYQFIIQNDPHYIDLSRNYLYMKLQIKPKVAPSDVNAEQLVAPINIIGKTFFKQVKVLVNGKLAFDSGSMYAYRAYLETELNYNSEVRATSLISSLYYKDSPPDKVDSKDNIGWKQRREHCKNDSVVEIMSPIHSDLFATDKFMLSNTEIQLELHRNSDEFCLMAFDDKEYSISVLEMAWYVKKLALTPSVHLGIEQALQRHSAKYPIRRIVMTKLSISPGRMGTPTTAIFNGQIPRRILVGFVDTTAFFGDFKKSPFVFKNNNVSEISIYAGGVMYPREPLRMDYSKNQFMRPFVQFFEGMGMQVTSNYVEYNDFKHMTCLYVFDLTAEDSDIPNWQLLKEGTTSVHALFSKAVPEPGLEMIVYGEFDNLALIDRTRNIHFDYTL